MGMYTEFHFTCQLKVNTPIEVINILEYILSPSMEYLPSVPDVAFFKTDRWRWLFSSSSYYFPFKSLSSLHKDNINNSYYLQVHSSLKNYTGEIGHFLRWIFNYVDACEGDLLGYYRYEEYEEPTLIRFGKDVQT